MKIRITREVELPNPLKLERFAKSPELGPSVLFFSGGTALRNTCRELVRYTYNSIHIITPFDSGGSSAKLRKAFAMPAIGDVRNRLMALADMSLRGHPEIYALFAHRLPARASKKKLAGELDSMARGSHPMVKRIPGTMRKIIKHHLRRFRELVPDNFDLRGASVGNLVLTSGYLENARHFDPVIFIFSKLVEVRGTVRPVLSENLHLGATLNNGKTLLGQHRLAGKEAPPIKSPVKELFLTPGLDDETPVRPKVREKAKKLIRRAGLVCYPMGSFYTSLIANLLPSGIGNTIAHNPCPKVYVPSTGNDPETRGMKLHDQVSVLLRHLRRDDPKNTAPEDVLDFVLLDSNNGKYKGGVNRKKIEKQGVKVIDCPLTSPKTRPGLDPRLLSGILLSLS